jgi:hypothetical protein
MAESRNRLRETIVGYPRIDAQRANRAALIAAEASTLVPPVGIRRTLPLAWQ